jgi:hypothetical protein
VPIELTTVLVALHVLAMVATAGVLGFYPADLQKWQGWTCFFASNFSHYWTLVTYPFYHNILSDHIFFAIEMLMFFWFGREVERYAGRRAFAVLYLLLILSQPAALLALKPLAGASLSPLAGSGMITFGIGVSFAVIYPNAQFFAVLAAKWIVWIFLSVFSVFFLARRDWSGLAQFWLVAITAYAFLRHAGVGAGCGGLVDWLENRRMERAEQKLRARAEEHQRRVQREEASVDSVLEKISRSGLASLDADEHEVLQRARQKLMRQDKRRQR